MKHHFFAFTTLMVCLIFAPSLNACSLSDSRFHLAQNATFTPQSRPSTDTLMLKRKVYYGDKKLKNLRELEAILKTADDAETMRLFKKFKTTITLANVLIIPVIIVAIPLMISSRGQLKAVIRRFNDVKMGRVK